METLRNFGTLCLLTFIVGSIYSILCDLGIIYQDPEDVAAQAQEVARQRHEASCLAARRHLKDFYAAYRDLLGESFPPSLMKAFIASEMGNDKNANQLWAICLDKITELLPLVARGRKEQVRIRQIDAEITACHERIARLEMSDIDPDLIDDEIEGQRLKVRQLETQKQYLVTLCNGEGAA